MKTIYLFGLIVLAAVLIGHAWAEQITLTTYYPAPYGVYKELKTTSKTTLAINSLDPAAANHDPQAKVGIGTENPETKLEVQDGPIKATGGLIIQYVNSNPTNLKSGQIWLRSDINP